MGSINSKKIEGKVKKYMNSSSGQKKYATNAAHYAIDGASEFIKYYKQSVLESQDRGMHAYGLGYLGPTAVQALLENVTLESYDYAGDYRFIVSINVGSDMTRPSLLESMYGSGDYVYDLVGLLNNGYGPIHARRVYGVWHGKYQTALRERLGSHFIERAIQKLEKASYRKKYRLYSAVINNEIYR